MGSNVVSRWRGKGKWGKFFPGSGPRWILCFMCLELLDLCMCTYGKMCYICSHCAAMPLWRLLGFLWEKVSGSLCIGHISVITSYLRCLPGSEDSCIRNTDPAMGGYNTHTHAPCIPARRLTAHTLMCTGTDELKRLLKPERKIYVMFFPNSLKVQIKRKTFKLTTCN